jgi:hypothetical protein
MLPQSERSRAMDDIEEEKQTCSKSAHAKSSCGISAKSVSRFRVVDKKSAIWHARLMFEYSDEEIAIWRDAGFPLPIRTFFQVSVAGRFAGCGLTKGTALNCHCGRIAIARRHSIPTAPNDSRQNAAPRVAVS